MSNTNKYYIICKRHAYRQDHAVLFWGKDKSGYSYNLDDAGVYTKEDIKEDDNYIELEFSYEELEIGGNPHIDCKEFYHKNL